MDGEGSNRLRFEFPAACIGKSADQGGYWIQELYVGLLTIGDAPPEAPQNSIKGPTIAIPDVPPPGRFEQSGSERFESSRGGFYVCR